MLNLSKSITLTSLSLIINREIELRENLVGTGFLDPPMQGSEYDTRVTVMGKNKNAYNAPIIS